MQASIPCKAPIKGLLISAGFEIINGGYDFKPLYVARARVDHKGEYIGTVCGKVFEGSPGELMFNRTPGVRSLIQSDLSSGSLVWREAICFH